MKKNIFKYISFALFLFVPFVISVFAENTCVNENNVSCAYCVYNVTGKCNINFAVSYRDDNTSLKYEKISSGSSSGNISCDFNYNNFVKNDFKDSNGNIICPNLTSSETTKTAGGRNWSLNIAIKPDTNGNIKSTSESTVKKITSNNSSGNNTKTTQSKETYVCSYSSDAIGDFTINVENGSLIIEGASKCNSVNKSLASEMFTNNNCPDLYVYKGTDNLNKTYCNIKSETGFGAIKTSGKLVNQNTGKVAGQNTGSKKTSTAKLNGTNLNYNSFCSNEGVHSSIKIISAIISIIKIAVPVIIIVLGMIDFFKAVISDDEKAISKATQSLIRRLISGVIVFFIPSILWALLNVIDITDGIHNLNNSEFGICTKCILKNQCN